MRWLLLAVGLAALLLVAEGTARALFDVPPYMLGSVYDPDLGYRQPPRDEFIEFQDPGGAFTFRTNTEGFRGPELPDAEETPPLDTARLLFLGDSFLVGWGVPAEALIPFSCEAELRARGHAVQAFNVSYSAIGTAQELILFRQNVARIQPSVVVLVVYPCNDVIDNTPELVGHTTISQGAYIRPFLVSDGQGGLETQWLNPLRSALRRHSRLYQNIEVRLLSAGLIQDPASGDLVPSQEDCIAAGRLPRTFLELYLPPEPGGPWAAGWKRTEDLLRAFQREVDAVGARFVVTSIPLLLQVEIGAQSLTMDAALRAAHQPLLGERVDWNLPEERLTAFTQAEGIAYVPLLDALREETRETRRTSYLDNWHLSARGHRRAGRVVAEALEHVLGGDPLPTSAPRSTAPVDVLEAAFLPAGRLDFAEDLHAEVLLGGWRTWMPAGKSGAGGWEMMGKQGSLGVPARSGTIVVEGWAPKPGLSVSLNVQFRHAIGPVTLEREGPFELKAPIPSDVFVEGSCIRVDLVLAGEDPAPRHGIVVTGLRFE